MTTFRSRSWIGLQLAAISLLLASAAAARAQDTGADPKALELSTQLLELSGSGKIGGQMLAQIGPMLTQLVEKANPGREAEADDVMRRFVLPKMAESLPELQKEAARLYAKHFTTDELGQLVAFYQSPIGRKLVAELPGMLKEMSVFAQAEGQKLAIDAMKAYADEFRKRGLQIPI